MRSFRTYAVLFLAIACLFSCGKKDKVIPRSTMADIYADLFIADYWIKDHYSESKIADTTRFYEPVFNKYGYTTLDFINSADYYLKDPRRYARIVQKAVSKLDDEAKRLECLSSDISSQEAEIEAYKSSAKIPRSFFDSLFFAVAASEKLVVEKDDCGAYMPVIIDPCAETCDTLAAETVEPSDSSAVLHPDEAFQAVLEEVTEK